MQRRRFLLCLLCCLLCQQAQALLLSAASSGQSINAQVELLEDTTGTLNIADMASPEVQQRFVPSSSSASVGLSRSAWWIKISLRRAADAPAQWWLENGGITIMDLRLYLPDGQGGWIERLSGEQVPYAVGRDHEYRRQVFRLPLLDEQPLTLYLRSYAPRGNSFPLKVWQLSDLNQYAATENLGLGLLYGIILALMLYNLFILISLRDAAYFWYVLATGGALTFILSMSGHGFQYLWPEQAVPFWIDRITLPALWAILVMRFTQELLSTRNSLRWGHWLMNLGCLLYASAILLNALGYPHTGAVIIALAPILSMPVALICAAIRMRQGFFPARLYLIGYGTVLVSTAVLVMRAAGIIQPGPFTAYLYPLAIAAESILFSFALAYRIQILKQEKAAALVQADREKSARLEQMQHFAEELQAAVDSRTTELESANQRLSLREQELQHAARHDPLTDLPNRRYLIEHTEAQMADAMRRQESLALLLIDLDHFKPINDTYGHDAGDVMLRTEALRLRQVVRSHDMVARLGGDEFAVLISGPNAQEHAVEIAERLISELAQPVTYHDHQLRVSISIGIALYPQHARLFNALYKTADLALYKAKSAGRSSYRLFGDDGELSSDACLQLDLLKVPSGLL